MALVVLLTLTAMAMIIFTRPATTLLPLLKPQTDASGLFPLSFSPHDIFLVDPALPPLLFITSLPASVPMNVQDSDSSLLSCAWSLGCVFPLFINIPFLLHVER